MGNIMMRPTDLGELYTLLTMYQDTYGSVPERFLEQVAEKYHAAAAVRHRDAESSSIPLITNPRGSGRKSKVKPEEKEQIFYLHKSGRTIREIAVETGYSTGLVHKLIHEHKDHDTVYI